MMLTSGININLRKGILNDVTGWMHSMTFNDPIDFEIDSDGNIVQFRDMVAGEEYLILLPYSININVRNIAEQCTLT